MSATVELSRTPAVAARRRLGARRSRYLLGAVCVAISTVMLLPLVIGLLVKARWESVAKAMQPVMAQISTISLALLLVLMLGLNISNVVALFGTGAIIATLLFITISIAAGYLLGGPSTDTKQVLALGSGQRNLSAAFIIATGSFADQPNVLVFLAAAGLVGMVTLFPTAAEFGKRSRATPEPETAPRSAKTSVSNQP